MPDRKEMSDMKQFDMSSTEPHITVDCPLCGNMDQVNVKVKTGITSCIHEIKYELTELPDGSVNVKMTIKGSNL